MKKLVVSAVVLASVFAGSLSHAAPPIFKEKKYFGPIPYNSLSVSAGFMSGADFQDLTDGLNQWAIQRHGKDIWEELGNGPYGRLSYERQLTPNHMLKLSGAFNYLSQSSLGDYVAPPSPTDTLGTPLEFNRDLKVYLLSLEFGFNYYFVSPEPERFSPYAGAGFAAVVPMVRLDTELRTLDGKPFSNPSETVHQNSFQAGLHLEFGIMYFISDRYAAGIEGKYQMAQSKFKIHDANFDLDYRGFILAFNLMYYL